MKHFNFNIRLQVLNTTGELSAAYFRFREGKVNRTIEVADGKAFADYSASGKLLGVEVIAPCNINVLKRLAKGKEREPISRFLHNSAPRSLVLA